MYNGLEVDYSSQNNKDGERERESTILKPDNALRSNLYLIRKAYMSLIVPSVLELETECIFGKETHLITTTTDSTSSTFNNNGIKAISIERNKTDSNKKDVNVQMLHAFSNIWLVT